MREYEPAVQATLGPSAAAAAGDNTSAHRSMYGIGCWAIPCSGIVTRQGGRIIPPDIARRPAKALAAIPLANAMRLLRALPQKTQPQTLPQSPHALSLQVWCHGLT